MLFAWIVLQDTEALENSGINPKDVVNNNIVGIHKYKRLYSRNSRQFVRIHNGKVDGGGDKHELQGECWAPAIVFPPIFLFLINDYNVTKTY